MLGITGTGGAGKSSLVDELVRRFLLDFEDKRMAIVSVDPSKRKTGGALLGDRIRMNAIASGRVYMRSLATRQSNLALSRHVGDALDILKAAGFDLIDPRDLRHRPERHRNHGPQRRGAVRDDPEFGAATQLEKIDMLDFADVVAINKFDKRGAPMPCATCASSTSATTSCGTPGRRACPSSAPSPRNSTTRA